MAVETKQKVAITIFGALSFAFVLLGVFQLKSHLIGPKKQVKTNQLLPTTSITEIFSTNKDSDGDGLTDFDEQSIYNSSAYITDSDSDGISDGVEVQQGKNPSCPEGKECVKGDFGFTADISDGTLQIGASEIKKPPVDAKELAGDISPKEIREILIKGGANSKSLEKVTDEQLLKMYQETLASSPELLAQKQVIDMLTLKDTKAIRQALKQAGAPAEIIDKMTDEELRKALEESLSKQ